MGAERSVVDQVMTCDHGCGSVPHRWRPSPEAGPHWRCSECGDVTRGLCPTCSYWAREPEWLLAEHAPNCPEAG